MTLRNLYLEYEGKEQQYLFLINHDDILYRVDFFCSKIGVHP